MTDQAPELLPCPLCNATLVLSGDYTHETAWNFWCHPDRDAQCILADYQIPTAQDMRTPLAHEAKMWNTRPTPAERPVPIGARLFRESIQNERSMKSAPPSSDAADSGADAERPVPQVREALPPTQEYFLRAMATNYAGGHCWDDLDGQTCVMAADEIKALRALTARPSDAAVAWRYRHKDTEGWSMLKNGRDPTEWLKQWTNTEYEVEALAPMRPEAADEIERLRNQLEYAHG